MRVANPRSVSGICAYCKAIGGRSMFSNVLNPICEILYPAASIIDEYIVSGNDAIVDLNYIIGTLPKDVQESFAAFPKDVQDNFAALFKDVQSIIHALRSNNLFSNMGVGAMILKFIISPVLALITASKYGTDTIP
ncbi:hypothetical protein BGZ95_005022, partial [Linnemannia exigua]